MPSTYERERQGSEEKDSRLEYGALESGDMALNAVKTGEEYFMSGSKLGILMTGLCMALFLIGLDTAIVSTAIPRITERFHSTKDVGWYGAAYFLALCSLQPLGGRIYAEFSLKWTFLTYFALFELGSLLCGVSVNSKMFIVSRAIAGAGGAGIVSGIMTIVAHIVPLAKRPAYFALGGATFGMATISGPLIGGAFTERATWRWCFYLNLPVGAVAAAAFIAFFNPPVRPNEHQPMVERLQRLDLIGAGLFMPSIIMLLLALQWGGNTYPWKSATIIGLFCGFGILFAVFVAWQLYMGDRAMIPPEFLTRRTIVSTCLASMFIFGSTFSVVYYIPEWFQVVKAASPIKSGVMNIALFVPQILGSIIAGTMITKLGYANPWILTGTIFTSVAAGLYSSFKPDTGHAAWIGFQVLGGLGTGFSMETPLTAAQTVLKTHEASVGISLVTFSQFIGGSIFVAIAQTIFSNRLLDQLQEKVPGIDAQAFLGLGTAAVRSSVSSSDLPAVIDAYNSAITSTFYVAAAASACGFLATTFLEWNSVKGQEQGGNLESKPEDGDA